MVYNFNLGIGWASSGVEYAQAYRANLFRKAGIPARFIFTDMFPRENIQHMTVAYPWGMIPTLEIEGAEYRIPLKAPMPRHAPIIQNASNAIRISFKAATQHIFFSFTDFEVRDF